MGQLHGLPLHPEVVLTTVAKEKSPFTKFLSFGDNFMLDCLTISRVEVIVHLRNLRHFLTNVLVSGFTCLGHQLVDTGDV